MFDLTKDIDKYAGIPPYASELYGVYQPLLGWQSNMTKKWIQRGGRLIDPRAKRILDGRILPGPMHAPDNFDTASGIVSPLEPGRGRSPYRVLLVKALNSELILRVQARLQAFVDEQNGRLPTGDEWLQVVNINVVMDPETGDLRRINDELRDRMLDEAYQAGQLGTPEQIEALKQAHLAQMQYESQIAAFLIAFAEGQGGNAPDELRNLFVVQEASPLSDLLRPVDPLATIDPSDKDSGALSPVGFVHLFRQYFFDLGTFLGEPVEHIWLSPGATTELVEVSTRKTIVERTEEMTLTSTNRSERSAITKDEISDAVKQENESSTKLGVSTTNTLSYYVYQGTVSASFDLSNTRREAREKTHKQNREQTEKLSSEIKRNFKSTFKTVTETTDTRSRRYVIQNPSDKLVNYELRRKMRRVGVQVQDIGTRLCWQVFIDDPGAALGLAELVHFAEAPDLDKLKAPEKLPFPTSITKKVVAPIPFQPILNYSNNNLLFDFGYQETIASPYTGKFLSRSDYREEDDQVIMGGFVFKFDPPQTGYELTGDIRLVTVQGNKQAVIRDKTVDKAAGTFTLIMEQLHFGGENVINLEMELVFAPTPIEIQRVEKANNTADTRFNEEKNRAYQESYQDAVRQRIKAASEIVQRPSWDLREEERTVVYRKLIRRLMIDSWQLPDTDENRRLSHVRAEVVRSIFDVDSMLYFVAPEWWMPQRRRGRLDLDVKGLDQTFNLTEQDLVTWGGEKRPDNYKITEESAPARLGSSLGWLMQLDGDNLRNAFLNAPWVKAVIPVHPGREEAALNWLQHIEGHEDDGWHSPYLGTAVEDAEFQGKEVGEVLAIIAERMVKENGGVDQTLKADEVYEKGFSHLQGGFNAGLAPNEVFSQWIAVLPTDQIVAVDYAPTDLMVGNK